MNSRVTVTKLDHTGRDLFTYYGTLVSHDKSQVTVRCLWDRLPPVTVGGLRIETGDILVEHFYREHRFNIFVVYNAAGGLKGWYCNIAEAVALSNETVRWRDLALDLVVLPDGSQVVLDEDEFEALKPSDELRRQAAEALDELRGWAAQGNPPFTDDNQRTELQTGSHN